MLKIVGYPDRLSAAPGETVAFKISVEEGDSFEARLVRVVHGDCNPAGPGLKFVHVPSDADGRHPGAPQRIDAGSFMRVDDFPSLAAGPFTVFAMVWPTLLRRQDQTLFCQWDPATESGLHVGLTDGGHIAVTVGDGGRLQSVQADRAMLERQWYSVAIGIDPQARRVTIEQKPVQPYALSRDVVAATFSSI